MKQAERMQAKRNRMPQEREQGSICCRFGLRPSLTERPQGPFGPPKFPTSRSILAYPSPCRTPAPTSRGRPGHPTLVSRRGRLARRRGRSVRPRAWSEAQRAAAKKSTSVVHGVDVARPRPSAHPPRLRSQGLRTTPQHRWIQNRPLMTLTLDHQLRGPDARCAEMQPAWRPLSTEAPGPPSDGRLLF